MVSQPTDIDSVQPLAEPQDLKLPSVQAVPEVEEDVSLDVSAEDFREEHLVDLIEQPAWRVLLEQVVKAEKMDPWNIDVVKLSDAYLARINGMKDFTFHLPANAILAASIFLAFKSRRLDFSSFLPQQQEDVSSFIESDYFDFSNPNEPGVVYEPEITAPLNRVPQNRVSLDELISAVQLIMDKKRVDKPKAQQGPNVESLITALKMHSHDINKQIERTLKHVEESVDSQGLVTFSHLVRKDTQVAREKGAGAESERLAVFMNFLPLLHLYNQQKIGMWQDAFFGEVFIRLGAPQTSPQVEEVAGPAEVEEVGDEEE